MSAATNLKGKPMKYAGLLVMPAGFFLSISALILFPRCADYQDVFVGGKVYFADGDCYARMTRAPRRPTLRDNGQAA